MAKETEGNQPENGKDWRHRTYYEVLGVSQTATPEQIKKAFRKLARETHPDRNPHDPEAGAKFDQVHKAYKTLTDVKKRQQYDRMDHEVYTGSRQGRVDQAEDVEAEKARLQSVFDQKMEELERLADALPGNYQSELSELLEAFDRSPRTAMGSVEVVRRRLQKEQDERRVQEREEAWEKNKPHVDALLEELATLEGVQEVDDDVRTRWYKRGRQSADVVENLRAVVVRTYRDKTEKAIEKVAQQLQNTGLSEQEAHEEMVPYLDRLRALKGGYGSTVDLYTEVHARMEALQDQLDAKTGKAHEKERLEKEIDDAMTRLGELKRDAGVDAAHWEDEKADLELMVEFTPRETLKKLQEEIAAYEAAGQSQDTTAIAAPEAQESPEAMQEAFDALLGQLVESISGNPEMARKRWEFRFRKDQTRTLETLREAVTGAREQLRATLKGVLDRFEDVAPPADSPDADDFEARTQEAMVAIMALWEQDPKAAIAQAEAVYAELRFEHQATGIHELLASVLYTDDQIEGVLTPIQTLFRTGVAADVEEAKRQMDALLEQATELSTAWETVAPAVDRLVAFQERRRVPVADIDTLLLDIRSQIGVLSEDELTQYVEQKIEEEEEKETEWNEAADAYRKAREALGADTDTIDAELLHVLTEADGDWTIFMGRLRAEVQAVEKQVQLKQDVEAVGKKLAAQMKEYGLLGGDEAAIDAYVEERIAAFGDKYKEALDALNEEGEKMQEGLRMQLHQHVQTLGHVLSRLHGWKKDQIKKELETYKKGVKGTELQQKVEQIEARIASLRMLHDRLDALRLTLQEAKWSKKEKAKDRAKDRESVCNTILDEYDKDPAEGLAWLEHFELRANTQIVDHALLQVWERLGLDKGSYEAMVKPLKERFQVEGEVVLDELIELTFTVQKFAEYQQDYRTLLKKLGVRGGEQEVFVNGFIEQVKTNPDQALADIEEAIAEAWEEYLQGYEDRFDAAEELFAQVERDQSVRRDRLQAIDDLRTNGKPREAMLQLEALEKELREQRKDQVFEDSIQEWLAMQEGKMPAGVMNRQVELWRARFAKEGWKVIEEVRGPVFEDRWEYVNTLMQDAGAFDDEIAQAKGRLAREFTTAPETFVQRAEAEVHRVRFKVLTRSVRAALKGLRVKEDVLNAYIKEQWEQFDADPAAMQSVEAQLQAFEALVADIAAYEESLKHAQVKEKDIGRLVGDVRKLIDINDLSAARDLLQERWAEHGKSYDGLVAMCEELFGRVGEDDAVRDARLQEIRDVFSTDQAKAITMLDELQVELQTRRRDQIFTESLDAWRPLLDGTEEAAALDRRVALWRSRYDDEPEAVVKEVRGELFRAQRDELAQVFDLEYVSKSDVDTILERLQQVFVNEPDAFEERLASEQRRAETMVSGRGFLGKAMTEAGLKRSRFKALSNECLRQYGEDEQAGLEYMNNVRKQAETFVDRLQLFKDIVSRLSDVSKTEMQQILDEARALAQGDTFDFEGGSQLLTEKLAEHQSAVDLVIEDNRALYDSIGPDHEELAKIMSQAEPASFEERFKLVLDRIDEVREMARKEQFDGLVARWGDRMMQRGDQDERVVSRFIERIRARYETDPEGAIRTLEKELRTDEQENFGRDWAIVEQDLLRLDVNESALKQIENELRDAYGNPHEFEVAVRDSLCRARYDVAAKELEEVMARGQFKDALRKDILDDMGQDYRDNPERAEMRMMETLDKFTQFVDGVEEYQELSEKIVQARQRKNRDAEREAAVARLSQEDQNAMRDGHKRRLAEHNAQVKTLVDGLRSRAETDVAGALKDLEPRIDNLWDEQLTRYREVQDDYFKAAARAGVDLDTREAFLDYIQDRFVDHPREAFADLDRITQRLEQENRASDVEHYLSEIADRMKGEKNPDGTPRYTDVQIDRQVDVWRVEFAGDEEAVHDYLRRREKWYRAIDKKREIYLFAESVASPVAKGGLGERAEGFSPYEIEAQYIGEWLTEDPNDLRSTQERKSMPRGMSVEQQIEQADVMFQAMEDAYDELVERRNELARRTVEEERHMLDMKAAAAALAAGGVGYAAWQKREAAIQAAADYKTPTLIDNAKTAVAPGAKVANKAAKGALGVGAVGIGGPLGALVMGGRFALKEGWNFLKVITGQETLEEQKKKREKKAKDAAAEKKKAAS